MKKSEFRTPLIQSAAVLGGVLILFTIVASSGASSAGGGVLAIIFGVGNLILFAIGMAIALLLSITILIAIFLAAVAMVNPEQASQMYADLKKNFSLNALTLNRQCCPDSLPGIGISPEEYDRMQQEIAQLKENNLILQRNIKDITNGNALLQDNVDTLHGENSALKAKIEELSRAVEELQGSEKQIKDLVAQLSEKIQSGADQELKNQLMKLEELHTETQREIENLLQRLKALESSIKQAPASGIFTYIENEQDQTIFVQKVEEAVAKDMTYAQIYDYLRKNLPPKLNKIIKDHPAFTKTYIRNMR